MASDADAPLSCEPFFVPSFDDNGLCLATLLMFFESPLVEFESGVPFKASDRPFLRCGSVPLDDAAASDADRLTVALAPAVAVADGGRICTGGSFSSWPGDERIESG